MNIAIASDDGINIASHLGKTKGFVIFKVQDERIWEECYRENTFTGHARGLSGQEHGIDRHGPILEALQDCKVVISHGMGRRIYDDLQQAGIEVFITDEMNAKDAAELYISNKLIDRPELGCNHDK
jgi:predicted Fe-Mo cluster-binding NifX family protein